jgi:hypothetical protein
VVNGAVAGDLDLEPLADEVGDRRADAVQAAGGLVGGGVVVAELAAGAEGGEDDLDGGDALGRVDADGDAAAVVGDGAGAVGVDLHVDRLAVAGEGLVDGVVDDLVDEVVQAARVVAADVHARAGADVLDVVEHADLGLVVLGGSTAAAAGAAPRCGSGRRRGRSNSVQTGSGQPSNDSCITSKSCGAGRQRGSRRRPDRCIRSLSRFRVRLLRIRVPKAANALPRWAGVFRTRKGLNR